MSANWNHYFLVKFLNYPLWRMGPWIVKAYGPFPKGFGLGLTIIKELTEALGDAFSRE